MQLRLFNFKPEFIRERRVLDKPAPRVRGNCPPCTGSCSQGRECPAVVRERLQARTVKKTPR